MIRRQTGARLRRAVGRIVMTPLPRLLMSLAWAILPANFSLAAASTAVEYFHSGYGHYFLTSSSRETYALDSGNLPGWNRTGQSFGVFELGTAPSANVCRFWSGQTFAPKSSHFYTPFDWECALTKGNRDWNFEGEVFAMPLPDAAGTCAGGTMPLYRLYNDGHGDAPNHRYTSSLAIRSDMMAKGWIPEGSGIGVSGCVQARPVAALSGITKIATGGYHTCALAASGGIKCWGWNDFGQLGNATTLRQVTPVDVSGLATGMVAVATGDRHTCALTASGGAKCWGENRWGQLGDGSTTDRLTPVDVSGLASGVAAIAPGGVHTCAVTTTGGVKCWGAIWIGLPDGSRVQSLTPIDVPGLEGGIVAIAAGGMSARLRQQAG